MSDFTKGIWEYDEYVPEGVTLNGKEYIIFTGSVNPDDDGSDIALARHEDDAKLIAAAPEMFEAITECADTLEAIKFRDDCKEAADFYQLEELIHALWELLARIHADKKEG